MGIVVMTVADFSILSVAVKLPVGFQKVNTNRAVPEGSVQLYNTPSKNASKPAPLISNRSACSRRAISDSVSV